LARSRKVLPPAESRLEAIDEWLRRQPDLPSCSEAIRAPD
jgi:hypothetical protein